MAQAKLFGSSIKRREDPRMITGQGGLHRRRQAARPDVRRLRPEPPRPRARAAGGSLPGQARAGGGGGVHRPGHGGGRRGPSAVRLAAPRHQDPRVPRGRHGQGQLRGARGRGRHRRDALRRPGRRRAGRRRLRRAARGDRRGEGRPARSAPDPRQRSRQRGLQLEHRGQGQDRRRHQGGAQGRQAAPDQPPPDPQCDRAAGLDGLVQLGDGRAHLLGHLPEPPRAPAAHGGVRAGDARAQGPGDLGGRRRRVRIQDLPLPGGGHGLLGVEAARTSGEVDGGAPGIVHDGRSRTGPHHRGGDGGRPGREDRRPPGPHEREPGRLPLDVRAAHPDLPLRAAPLGRVQDPRDLLRGDRVPHQHDAGRRVSGRGPSRGDVSARADVRPDREGHRRGRRGVPAEEPRAGLGVPVPDAGRVPVRQRELRAGPRPGAPDDRLPEVPRRPGSRAETGPLPGDRVRHVHRGLRAGALRGGGRARRPGRPLGERSGSRHPDREDHGLHGLALPRPGARDLLRPAGGRRAAGALRGRRDRPRRHRGRSLRHGHLRQPLGRRGRLRHLQRGREDQGEGQEDRRAPSRGERGRHRVPGGEVRGQRVAGPRQDVRRGRADGVPGAQPAEGARAGARGDLLLGPEQLRLPLRDPHRGRRGQPRRPARSSSCATWRWTTSGASSTR